MYSLPIVAAYGLFASCIGGALFLHCVPALLAGLLSFTLTRGVLRRIQARYPSRHLEWLAALLVGIGSVAVLTGIAGEVRHYVVGDSLPALILKLADTLQHIKQYLHAVVAKQIPDSWLEAKGLIAAALKTHANLLARLGSKALEHLALTLIGWIVGVLIAVQHSGADERAQPQFAATWRSLWTALSDAFGRVAYAQAKIAAVNATLTAVFLLVIMPLAGWKMPYATTLIVVTFLCGLVPVVGNIASNTLVCVLALSVAFPAAVIALVFLVLVHKFEYFLSARIQGQEIGAKAWEILIVLFVFEMLFGPAGMVMAPVFYAFIIAHLRLVGWLDAIEAERKSWPKLEPICRD
ncbi:AI-2E family transporter [Paraburkholderia sp. EG287A]|uniref:AI-2E family transporter n=1 Tax=Paraburkholderia sp. EG287A TaxID=3237012 RepID=UPI0034D37512